MPEVRETQHKRSEMARLKLIDATVQVLAQGGYQNTTFNKIQDVSGMSRGLISYHFGTKEELVEAVVLALRDRYQAVVGRERTSKRSGLDALRYMVDTYLSRLSKNPLPAKIMLTLGTESVDHNPLIRTAVQQRYAEMRAEIADFIIDGQSDKTVKSEVDPVSAATLIQGLLRGVTLQFVVDPEAVCLEKVRTSALSLIDSYAAEIQ